MVMTAAGAAVESTVAGSTCSWTCCVLLVTEFGPTIVPKIVTVAPTPVVEAGGTYVTVTGLVRSVVVITESADSVPNQRGCR